MTTCHGARLRCPVCANPDWHSHGPTEECTHCGLVVCGVYGLEQARAVIPVRLAAGRAKGSVGDRWSLSRTAWRNAAWRFGFVLDDDKTRAPAPRDHAITLAVMTRPSQAEATSDLIAALAFARTIVAIDDVEVGAWADVFAGAHVLAHPLDGNFAAQRNRLQAAAGSGWVLHLDSDERADPVLLDNLGWLVAAAARDGLRSLGLPRRNLVDGRMSALYPDIQYRLNHADVRYTGAVHEHPVVPFARTSLALVGAIEHRLDAARVRARTRAYAAMSVDGERIEDEVRLLRTFDAIADR